jgi:hypothetical protein
MAAIRPTHAAAGRRRLRPPSRGLSGRTHLAAAFRAPGSPPPADMGYVACTCCICAGPVSHGFGLEGALEQLAEEAAEAAAAGPGQGEAGAAAVAAWALPVEEMRWLEALQVVTPACGEHAAAVSDAMEYLLHPA